VHVAQGRVERFRLEADLSNRLPVPTLPKA